MKHIYLLLLCLFCLSMKGQIAKLNEFSKGNFYSSDVIRDEKNNIKGYFLLYKTDKVANQTFGIEYVVLDENFTRVTNGYITEMKYESWILDSERINVNVVGVYNNKLLIELSDEIEGIDFYTRYRVLDLKSYEISKPFVYKKNKMDMDPVFKRSRMSLAYERESERIGVFDGIGLVVDNHYEVSKNSPKRYLAHYDDNFKEVWRYEYSDKNNREKTKNISYLASDEDVLVLFNQYSKYDKATNQLSLLFIDAKKGKLKVETGFPEREEFSYRIVDCYIKGGKVYVLGKYGDGNKIGLLRDEDNFGLYELVFDKASGKLLESNYFKWESLMGKLDIKKNGYVKKEGLLYTHRMLLKEDGGIIAVAEAFTDGITTNDLFFFEFDSKLGLKDMLEVSKFKNSFSGASITAETIRARGYFDFMDCQDLGDDEYLFFFNDNEKNVKNRKSATLYGVVSYSGGKFKKQTINLKTDKSAIRAYSAKKGYLLLIENFDGNKSSEFRLEKINY
ncbi:DUF6770 family protein [Flavobacterium suzhouense]|uniref:DUF6770 family protein n=1 Tax=Flavobacterium suzhouense TaxID=1529638 RepID=A0ABW5NTN8_9FLAO